jgi:serine/threonine-protein kinase
MKRAIEDTVRLSVDGAGHARGKAPVHVERFATPTLRSLEHATSKPFPATNAMKPAAGKAATAQKVGLLVAALAVVAGAIAYVRDRQANVAAASAAVPSASAPKARVSIVATPADARIFVDGVAVGDNPAQLTLPRDGASHRVRVEANGFATKEDGVVLDGASVNIELALEPLRAGVATTVSVPSSSARPARSVEPTGGRAKVAPAKGTPPLSSAPGAKATVAAADHAPSAPPLAPTSTNRRLLDTGNPWTW